MIYQDKEVKLKDGRSAVLRNARVEDSADLIEYLKTTATETPYLINELEEITLTLSITPYNCQDLEKIYKRYNGE